MCEIPWQNLLKQLIYTSTNEEQGGKTSTGHEWVAVGVEMVSRQGKEGKYDGCTLYMCMKIEQ
jgi:hypothetical protein